MHSEWPSAFGKLFRRAAKVEHSKSGEALHLDRDLGLRHGAVAGVGREL